MSLFGFRKKKVNNVNANSLRYEFVTSDAERQMQSEAFKQASRFTRAYGRALVEVIPVHIAGIVLGHEGVPTVTEKWQTASETQVRDLASLLSWLHANDAFGDVNVLYKPEDRRTMYEALMNLSGDFFGTGERAVALCQKYQACMDGEFAHLGGGTLAEGGTYLVYSDNAFMTTHLWMINESLGGPPLNVHELGPEKIFYLQMSLCKIMTTVSEAFLERARDIYRSQS